MTTYIVTKEIEVEAETQAEAVGKVLKGNIVISLPISIQIKPATPDFVIPAGVPNLVVPIDQWPIWAKGFKMVSKSSDIGIGDTIARIIGPENSYAFKKWYKRIFKQDCGCTGRQARWNQMYPLK